MSDTPKYIGILDTENDGELWYSEHPDKAQPTREEFDAYLNAERERIAPLAAYGTITPELYIRERDTRRQFSPEQIRIIRDRLWSDMGIDIGNDVAATVAINFILEEYRKLINEP